MTIGIRIEHMKYTSEKVIQVGWTKAEYHPQDSWFFFSDLESSSVEEFIPKELLDKELALENHYTSDGQECIFLGWEI